MTNTYFKGNSHSNISKSCHNILKRKARIETQEKRKEDWGRVEQQRQVETIQAEIRKQTQFDGFCLGEWFSHIEFGVHFLGISIG
jgi:hypothetical protein